MRSNTTDAERVLWERLRRKQVFGLQLYRQKPIGNFIADFYAPKARLVIEIDGSQHQKAGLAARDAERTQYLEGLGLRVIRFDNLQVLGQPDAVVEQISRVIAGGVRKNPP